MTNPSVPARTPWPWVVAGLGWAYYMTPALAAVVADQPLSLWWLLRIAGPGVLALVALRWRTSRPVASALACAVLWAVSPTVIGAAAAAQESVARRSGRLLTTVGIGAALVAGKGIESWGSTRGGAAASALQVELILAVVAVVVASLVGLLARARLEAREDRVRAEAARHEAELARLAEARLAERERIAREMHDAIAHRLSLVALHAGALAYRSSTTPQEYRETAELIQANAQASLDELRAMLTTLRSPGLAPEAPQPTLEQAAVLAADAEDVGQQVRLRVTGDLAAVPVRVSRHGFRILQEAITNARKHAPGSPVDVAVSHETGAVRVHVVNPIADLAPPDRTGAGLGLIGVDERVALLGGSVSHGVQDGRFVLDVVLPIRDAKEQL